MKELRLVQIYAIFLPDVGREIYQTVFHKELVGFCS